MNVSVNGKDPAPAISAPAHAGPILAKITAWFADRSTAITDRIFAEPDERARRNGWSVEIRHGGMSRRYRDPRFESLRDRQSSPQFSPQFSPDGRTGGPATP
jgi:hypothetical protein